jgi:hypothetical protein
MPQVSRFFGIVIFMYFNDHSPAHFHAQYSGQEAIYEIETLEIQRGNLQRRAHGLVMEWASLHWQELLDDWIRAGWRTLGRNRSTRLRSKTMAKERVLVRVRSVIPKEPNWVVVKFENGEKREIDLTQYLSGPIFAPVRDDPDYFKTVQVRAGTLSWENGADIDPDVLYYELTPAWMEETEST